MIVIKTSSLISFEQVSGLPQVTDKSRTNYFFLFTTYRDLVSTFLCAKQNLVRDSRFWARQT